MKNVEKAVVCEYLRRARRLINAGWIDKHYSKSDYGYDQFCTLGAINQSFTGLASPWIRARPAHKLATLAVAWEMGKLLPCYLGSRKRIMNFNDSLSSPNGRQAPPEVIAAFDAVINRLARDIDVPPAYAMTQKHVELAGGPGR